jgi:hypothetical protein
MRTTADLIGELDQEAGNFTGAALVVVEPDATIFVFANDPARLGKLHDALTAGGGEPVGILAFDVRDDGLLTVRPRVLAGVVDSWQERYLEGLVGAFTSEIPTAYPDALKDSA